VSIPLPLWNRRQGPIAEAQASLKQAQAIAEQRRLELNAELERAYGLYQTANQQVISFEAGALKAAEAALQAAQAAYRFGERGIIEVLDAQRVLQTIRGEFLDAQAERQSAVIDLEELGAFGAGGQP
jgi:outer membrane protein, heavy metal efflux system